MWVWLATVAGCLGSSPAACTSLAPPTAPPPARLRRDSRSSSREPWPGPRRRRLESASISSLRSQLAIMMRGAAAELSERTESPDKPYSSLHKDNMKTVMQTAQFCRYFHSPVEKASKLDLCSVHELENIIIVINIIHFITP